MTMVPLFAHGVTGAGETIVLVDCFGAPYIQTSLATFDTAYGLPNPPSFKIIRPDGPVPAFNPATGTMIGWLVETSLDVEYSHAMAPGANILLVETPVAETEGTAGFPQIVEAENYVIDHHLGDVISQSFAATEETFPNVQSLLNLRSAYVNAYEQGVTVLGSTGDTGATSYATATAASFYDFPVVNWPATDPLVTAVGGTQLSLNTAGQRTAPDVVWNDTYDSTVTEVFNGVPAPTPDASSGGLSTVFSRPSYQSGVARVVGNDRGVPDVSMNGACGSPVNLAFNLPTVTPGTAWTLVCGTSEASPLMAGIVALADQVAHHSLGLINPALYLMSSEHAPGLVDVTKGTNTVSWTQTGKIVTVQGYSAGPGYDLASGVGTVNAAEFVPELVQAVARAGNQVSYGILTPSSFGPHPGKRYRGYGNQWWSKLGSH